MIITSRTAVVLTTVVTAGFLGAAGSAAAGGPEDVTTYSCDALTSASVPAVKKRLTDQGIDPSTVTGPVGLSCRKSGHGDEVEARVAGVDGVAYRCASAEDKSGTKIVFFVDCGQQADTGA